MDRWRSRTRTTRFCRLLVVVAAVLLLLVLPPLLSSLLCRSSCNAHAAYTPGPGVVGVTAVTIEADSTRSQQYDLIKAEGFPAVRLIIGWPLIEPHEGQLDWGPTDAIVMGAFNRGLTVLGLLYGAPSWAVPPQYLSFSHLAPADPNLFGAFAMAAAQHYRGVIRNWEIWNEANIGSGFGPAANLPLYSAMLKNAYSTIKSVDPDSVIISGGTSPSIDTDDSVTPANFIRGLYQNGAGDSFDAVAMHPYSSPDLLSDVGPSYSSHRAITEVSDVMAAHGQSYKRIWFTEFGASTAPEGARSPNEQDVGVTEARQAQILTDGIIYMRSLPNCGPIFVFDHQDGERSIDAVNHYGLLRSDFSPKPALSAVQALFGPS
jgi:hypothetical protein